MGYYSAIKRNKSESVPVRWMNLEPVIQSEVSQKNKYQILMHIYGIQKDGTDYLHGSSGDVVIENRLVDTEWEGKGGTNGKSSMETFILPYVKQIASGNLLYDSGSSNQCCVAIQRDGMGWEMGGRFQRKGIYVYLWLIHVDVWKKQTQYCKASILQLKIKIFKKKLLKEFQLFTKHQVDLVSLFCEVWAAILVQSPPGTLPLRSTSQEL